MPNVLKYKVHSFLVQGECDLLHFLVPSQHAQHGDGHFRKPVGGSHQGGDDDYDDGDGGIDQLI